MTPIETTGPLLTTNDLAALLDRHPGTIANHARKYNVGIIAGKTRLYDEQAVARMREIVSRPSGPRKKETM